MRMRSHRDSNLYVRAIDYINTTWPHFQKLHGGERHIMIHSGVHTDATMAVVKG